MLFLMSLLIWRLTMPLKVNAMTATPTPLPDLVQISLRVNKTETYGKLKYKIDFFADTGDESNQMYYAWLSNSIRFSSSLDLVSKEIGRECSLYTVVNTFNNYDNTKWMNFGLNCKGKGGKVNILSIELEPNIPDKVDHVLFLEPWRMRIHGRPYPDEEKFYRVEWVSGYSNYMILSDFSFGSGCGDDKKMGDYNNDGEVNGLNYSYWKQEFVDKIQHDGRWEASHVCGDGVTPEDYSVWRYNYLDLE